MVLLAHSWGTIIGTLYVHRHPEDVAAYVGVGQIANMPEGERASYDWVLAEAKRRENRKAVAELQRIGPPPHALSAMRTERGWVSRFGGDIYAAPTTVDLILEALQADEFNLLDLILTTPFHSYAPFVSHLGDKGEGSLGQYRRLQPRSDLRSRGR